MLTDVGLDISWGGDSCRDRHFNCNYLHECGTYGAHSPTMIQIRGPSHRCAYVPTDRCSRLLSRLLSPSRTGVGAAGPLGEGVFGFGELVVGSLRAAWTSAVSFEGVVVVSGIGVAARR